MTIENTPPSGDEGGTLLAPPVTPPPPPAPPPEPVTISMTSNAFKERLKDERQSANARLLKDLGVEKPEDLRAALATLKTFQEQSLTEQERASKRIKELEPFEQQAKAYEAELASMVEEQFATLPEAWQKAIDAVAGGKPAERARMMKTFRAQGLLGSAPPAPKPAPPTDLGPAGGPPPPPVGQKTAWQEYQLKKAANPMSASLFYQGNTREIEASRPADQ